jgi:hypothetical protein
MSNPNEPVVGYLAAWNERSPANRNPGGLAETAARTQTERMA